MTTRDEARREVLRIFDTEQAKALDRIEAEMDRAHLGETTRAILIRDFYDAMHGARVKSLDYFEHFYDAWLQRDQTR